MTVATPHLGVHDYNFLSENSLPVPPPYIVKLFSRLMYQSGEDLLSTGNASLLYRMSTDEQWLAPLRLFRERRLYANLNLDFVVPLGTAAFLSKTETKYYRDTYRNEYGIVAILNATTAEDTCEPDSADKQHLIDMICSLNSVGWEKVLVHFRGVLPLAHNKICSLWRPPHFLTNGLLGFSQGRPVMEHAADWIAATDTAAVAVTTDDAQ